VFGFVYVLGAKPFKHIQATRPGKGPSLQYCGDSCGDAFNILKYKWDSLATLGLEFGPKTADKKSSEDGGCVETTAVIHRTRWVEHKCSGRFVSVLGGSAHM
jgi:hypothetical protein